MVRLVLPDSHCQHTGYWIPIVLHSVPLCFRHNLRRSLSVSMRTIHTPNLLDMKRSHEDSSTQNISTNSCIYTHVQTHTHTNTLQTRRELSLPKIKIEKKCENDLNSTLSSWRLTNIYVKSCCTMNEEFHKHGWCMTLTFWGNSRVLWLCTTHFKWEQVWSHLKCVVFGANTISTPRSLKPRF